MDAAFAELLKYESMHQQEPADREGCLLLAGRSIFPTSATKLCERSCKRHGPTFVGPDPSAQVSRCLRLWLYCSGQYLAGRLLARGPLCRPAAELA